MTTVFPTNNLPTAAQPWGREVQKQLANLIASTNSERINNTARDNQLNSSIIALNGVVQEVSVVAQEASDAINGLIGLSSTGSTYTINAANITAGSISGDRISGGTITGSTVQTSSTTGVSLNNATNSISFRVGTTTVGHIVPLSDLGILTHYGSTVDPSGGTFPQVYVGGTIVALNQSTTRGFGITSSGSTNRGPLFVDGALSSSSSISGSSISTGGTLSAGSSVFFTGLSSTTNPANVRVGTTGGGQIFVVTSARKYKFDVQDIEVGLGALKLRPRTWIDKGEYERNGNSANGLTRIPGFVAEEVLEAGLNDFVLYDELGEVQGLSYDRMLASVIPVLKHHEDKIIELTERIKILENGA